MENIGSFVKEQIAALGLELERYSEESLEKLREIARNDTDPDERNFVKCVHRATRVRADVYRQVKHIVEGVGYRVEECRLRGGVQGQISIELNRIQINRGHHAGVRIGLLLHEWAHGILHRYVPYVLFLFDPGPIELEAEAVSYVVCKALGINNRNTVPYIRGYGQTGYDLIVHTPKIYQAACSQIEALSAAGLC